MITDTLKVVADTLRDHPMIGIFGSAGGSSLQFVESIGPVLRSLGFVFAVLIGAVTLFLKIVEVYDRFKEKS